MRNYQRTAREGFEIDPGHMSKEIEGVLAKHIRDFLLRSSRVEILTLPVSSLASTLEL